MSSLPHARWLHRTTRALQALGSGRAGAERARSARRSAVSASVGDAAAKCDDHRDAKTGNDDACERTAAHMNVPAMAGELRSRFAATSRRENCGQTCSRMRCSSVDQSAVIAMPGHGRCGASMRLLEGD